MAFIAGAVIGSAVLGAAGSAIGAGAAGKAADQQAAAAHEANQLQEKMYNQNREDSSPYRQAGATALSGMQDPYFQHNFGASDFQTDPGYQFRMQEGQKALERSAAASGQLQGGGTMKALSQYGQNFASNEYQNAYNRFTNDQSNRFGRLSNIAGLGQAAVAGVGAAGQNYANNVGQNMMGAANAQGAAGIAGANAWSGGLSNIGRSVMDGVAMGNQNNLNRSWMDLQAAKLNQK